VCVDFFVRSNREMIKLSFVVRRCPSVSVCKEFLPKCKHMYAQYYCYCMEYGIICEILRNIAPLSMVTYK